ncbi:Hypothetical predicted protein, partial [Drosophila guanche]
NSCSCNYVDLTYVCYIYREETCETLLTRHNLYTLYSVEHLTLTVLTFFIHLSSTSTSISLLMPTRSFSSNSCSCNYVDLTYVCYIYREETCETLLTRHNLYTLYSVEHLTLTVLTFFLHLSSTSTSISLLMPTRSFSSTPLPLSRTLREAYAAIIMTQSDPDLCEHTEVWMQNLVALAFMVSEIQALNKTEERTARRTDGQTDMAQSNRLLILIKNIYTLWGRKRFLLCVTYIHFVHKYNIPYLLFEYR